LIKAKNIFPFLNKTIKLRKYKIKELNNFLNNYIFNFLNLNSILENYKNIFNIFIIKNLFIYFLKFYYIYIIIIKKFNNLFFLKNKNIFSIFLNKQLLLNKI